MFDQKVLTSIRNGLMTREESVAVAESVTSGLLQCALSQAKDASCFFQGGIVAYNIGQKARLLAVEPIHAQACDCVSEKVAQQMAANVAGNLRADWGISITGYAASTKDVSQPFVFYCITCHGKVIDSGRIVSSKKEGWLSQRFFVEKVLVRFGEIIS